METAFLDQIASAPSSPPVSGAQSPGVLMAGGGEGGSSFQLLEGPGAVNLCAREKKPPENQELPNRPQIQCLFAAVIQSIRFPGLTIKPRSELPALQGEN